MAVATDPEVVGIPFATAAAVVAWVVTSMLALIGLLGKHSAKVEKELLVIGITTAKQQADAALTKLGELSAVVTEMKIAIVRGQGENLALKSDVQRLEGKDDSQGWEIQDLRSRIDKGARTLSAQMPAHDQGPEPMPPMRRRLPSSRGGE